MCTKKSSTWISHSGMRSLGCAFLLLCCTIQVQAQELNIPLNRSYYPELEKALTKKTDKHLSFLGISYNELDLLTDSSMVERKWLSRKLFHESLIRIDSGDFHLSIDPLLNLELGQDSKDISGQQLYTNTRGVLIRGQIGERLAFESSFRENQSFFGPFLRTYINEFGVVPGSGRVKPFKTTGFDYAMASGYLKLKVTDWLNVWAGHGKQFLGSGYRSLLLSDNAFNYPYVRAELSLFKGKLRYQYMSATLRELERLPATKSTEAQFRTKLLSTNYLSFKPSSNFEIALFESVSWERWDQNTLALNYAAFLPIIGVNSATQSDNNRSRSQLGLNALFIPRDGLALYGQLSRLEGGMFSYQTGLKLAGWPLEQLITRLEFNHADAQDYFIQSPESFPAHYNQSLRHPRVASFSEVVVRNQINFGRVFLKQHLSLYLNTQDDKFIMHESNFPPDALALYYLPTQNVVIQNYEISYLLNPSYALNVAAGVRIRSADDVNGRSEMSWLYFALRTSLSNVYFDF